MSRKPLFIAALTAALGVGLAHLYLERLEREVSGGNPVGVLMTVRAVPAGALLDETALAVRQVPEAYVDPRAVLASDAEDVLGLPLVTALRANDGLVWSDVTGGTSEGRQLSNLVTEGMRAVTLSDDVDLFDGLLRPGDRVDVLETDAGGARILLENLLVLAVGRHLGGSDDAGPPGAGSVSLSVTVAQAETIAFAQRRGRLRLALRNPADVTVTERPSAPAADPDRTRKPTNPTREIEHVR